MWCGAVPLGTSRFTMSGADAFVEFIRPMKPKAAVDCSAYRASDSLQRHTFCHTLGQWQIRLLRGA